MRGAVMGAGVLLMAGVLTGCGGSPDDASEKDFCDAFQNLGEAGDDFDKSKDAFKDLGDTGTPDDIPDDAREGFDIILDIADESDDQKDAEKKVEDLSKDEQKKVEAFSTYTVKKCMDMPDLPSDLPTELPSDLPTELPSDLPTELPSDLPTDIPSDLLSPTS
ncbi:MAG: PT domain-containing protein [Nocardioides sp.]